MVEHFKAASVYFGGKKVADLRDANVEIDAVPCAGPEHGLPAGRYSVEVETTLEGAGARMLKRMIREAMHNGPGMKSIRNAEHQLEVLRDRGARPRTVYRAWRKLRQCQARRARMILRARKEAA